MTSQSYNDLRAASPMWLEHDGPRIYEFGGLLGRFPSMSATAGAAEIDLLETDGSATELVSQTAAFGALELTQAANDNDVISLRWNAPVRIDLLKPGVPFEMWFKFKVTDADDCDVSIGLAPDDNSIEASEPTDIFIARLRDGSAGLDVRYGKDSDYGLLDNLIAVADDTPIRGYMSFTPTSGNMDSGILEYSFHSNGTYLRDRKTINNQFPDDLVLFPVIQFQNGAAAADVMTAYWFYGRGLYADYVDGTG